MPGDPGVSPFLSIWFSPRVTMRRIVDANAQQHDATLVTLVTFFAVLDIFAARVPLEPQAPIAWYLSLDAAGAVLMAAVLSPLGMPTLPPLGSLFRWICRWFGGTATRQEVIAVLAWSCVPVLTTWTIVWLVQALLFGRALFTAGAMPVIEEHLAVFLPLGLLHLAGSIWSAVVMVAGLAEVNRFPVLTAVAAAVAGSAILVVPAIVIALIIVAAIVVFVVSNA